MTKLLIRLFIKNSDDINNQNVRQKYGVLGTVTGIFCNLLLSAVKFLAGFLTSSISITADALNNLSDAGSSIVSFVGFKMSGRPADDDHPFGHGRAEYVSGLIVAMVIILMGFELAKTSITNIFKPEDVKFSIISLIILIVSITVKLWMSLFYRNIAKTINSVAIKAAAMDSLSDVIATSTVLIGMLITRFVGINVDACAGFVVSLFILYAGLNTARDTLSPLLGQAPSANFVSKIENKVLSYEGVIGIHDLIVHNYGPNRSLISLHAEVPCDIDILSIHDTIDNIEREIKREFDCETVIHMDPIATNDKVSNEMYKKISALVKLIDKRLQIHDFRMVEGKTHTNLIFDVVVPHRFRLKDSEVKSAIIDAVKILDETYECVINVDKEYVCK